MKTKKLFMFSVRELDEFRHPLGSGDVNAEKLVIALSNPLPREVQLVSALER
jgi:hypothetical protein